MQGKRGLCVFIRNVTVTVVTVKFGTIMGSVVDGPKLKNLEKNDNYDRSAMPLATAGTQEMTVSESGLRIN